MMMMVVKWPACSPSNYSDDPAEVYSFYSVHCLKRTKINGKEVRDGPLKSFHKKITMINFRLERSK